MTPELLLSTAIRPVLKILPGRMESPAAEALLVTIALQESTLVWRYQQDGDDDPYDHAVGWWQFERIGVKGVQEHRASADYASGLNRIFVYRAEDVHRAIAHNDVLAAGYARLALWRLPGALPDGRMDHAEAWRQYIECWRPSEPREKDWRANYNAAWSAIEARR